MSIPELDLKKVNLQAAVGYLISLHDNEVDWNLLGIKVIGAIDALPIPDGNYEYGDAYMVGTETPYDMYIYTRPDGKVHTEGYWFPIGKFPMPGPKGDKGDGLETISSGDLGTVQRVDYDVNLGAEVQSTAKLKYIDANNGSTKTQEFPLTYKLPIVPGKYVSIDANSNNDALTIKMDNTALALDYVPINKVQSSVVPRCQNGQVNWTLCTSDVINPSIMMRDNGGNTKVNNIYVTDSLKGSAGGNSTTVPQIYYTCANSNIEVAKTSTDTGTLSIGQLQTLTNYQQTKVIYNKQVYYAMDPRTAPNGTLNFIHLDSIDDDNGGYHATGKCFSIIVSTRAWKVFDLDFGGQTTHNLLITDNVSGNGYYFQLATNQSAAYTTADVSAIIAEVKGKIIPCVFRKGRDSDKKFYSGILQASDAGFSCYYGEQNMDFGTTPTQVTVKDNV